jgi:hypothetical protein
MAQLYRYVCGHCGYEIETCRGPYDALMIDEFVTARCSKCKTVSRYFRRFDLQIPEPFPFEDEGLSAEQIQNVNTALEHCYCKECGSKGTLQLWSPACGCPKCGRKRTFKASDIYILAD